MDTTADALNLPPVEGISKHRTLSKPMSAIMLTLFAIGVVLTILQIFYIVPMFVNFYMYLLLALFLSPVFLYYGVTKKATEGPVPWYDLALTITTFGIFIYLTLNAFEITNQGWAFGAPSHYNILCLILVPISLEAVRRVGGTVLFVFAAFFAAYPLFADYMPGLLGGASFPLNSVLNYHILSTDSVLGLPLQVVGSMVIGYLIFGVVLTFTGGGKFFLDISDAIFGAQIGGAAKTTVVSSGLFGTLSGSVISNILTSGPFTIPAMKKTGYPAHYAAAVEACSSAGGCILPPVMGAVAFVMASYLQVPYWDVAAAAALPALLYFWTLFIQVHCHAGRHGLYGIDKSLVPQLGPVLKRGWPYALSFVVMTYFIYYQQEGQAAFYASLVLLAAAIYRGDVKLNIREALRLLKEIGLLIVEVTAVLVACGFILGSFSMTGLGSSFAREITMFAGNVPILLLVFGALASFILGMGMTITACYIFLAAVLAPALVNAGFSLMASHLFVLYWGLASYITPPVALGTYVAAGIVGAHPMRAAVAGMHLGMAKYIVPFVFVYQPALILEASFLEVVHVFLASLLGFALLGGSFEGYVPWFRRLNTFERGIVAAAGVALLWPGWIPQAAGIGIVLAMAAIRGEGPALPMPSRVAREP